MQFKWLELCKMPPLIQVSRTDKVPDGKRHYFSCKARHWESVGTDAQWLLHELQLLARCLSLIF